MDDPGACAVGRDDCGRRKPRDMFEAPALDWSLRPGAPEPRRVLLINPFYAKDPHGSFGKHVLTPTLALSTLAGATPAHWQVRIWDENLRQGPPPCEPFPQMVGISVHLTFARRAYELSRWYRQRGALVVLGGLHVNGCPDEAAGHADAIALGDGVMLWPRILRDVEEGTLQPRYDCAFTSPYREEPLPRRDLLDRASYLTTASLNATRGCHNRCGFCYLATDGLRMPYQAKDPQQVADEFLATGEPYGVFTDNNLGANRKYLWRLCEALEPIERIWSAAVSLDVSDDPALVEAMARAGCTGVFVGFESLTPANLADAGKRCPTPDDYARRVAIFHRAGVQVNGSFVFGFDHDTPDTFAATVRWIEAQRLECATFHILTPYPATPLFRQLEAEGRILHRNWDLYDTGHVVFQPRGMTCEQLAAGHAWCYRRVFSPRSIWRRRPREAGQVLSYLAMSVLYKKCNWLWPVLIRHRLTHGVWRPLVEMSRRRHVRWRRKLRSKAVSPRAMVGYAGV